LAHAVIPDRVRVVEIWADNDVSGTGQKAARALASRLVAEGCEVRIMVPATAGTDWLDVLNQHHGFALETARAAAPPFVSQNGDDAPPRRHRRFLNDLESLALPDVEWLLGRVLPL